MRKQYGVDNLPIFFDTQERDVVIPSPIAGQMCIVKTPGMQFLVYRDTAPVGWFPPWNTAWGLAAPEAVVTTGQNFAGTTADVTGLTVTFTAIQNRLYVADSYYPQQSFNATGLCTWRILDTANTTHGQVVHGGGNVPIAQYMVTRCKAPAKQYGPGSVTLRVGVVAGSVDVRCTASAIQPAIFSVTDVGPVPGT